MSNSLHTSHQTLQASSSEAGNVIAVDIGGTKIASGILNDQGKLLFSKKVSTPRQSGGAAVLDCVLDQVEELIEGKNGSPFQAVGISTGGQVDESGKLIGGTMMIPGWVGTPIREAVSKRFSLPAWAINDGHAAALAEARLGAGQGQPSMLCIVIGTGLGGGLVIKGKVQHGSHGLAGSLGQIKISLDGEEYVPLEEIVSGPGLMAIYNRHFFEGERVSSGKQVAVLALHGEPVAIQVIQEMGEWLGLGLSHALHCYDAACVVVGGSVAQIGNLFLESARLSLKKHGHSTIAETPIWLAKLGPDAGLIGAGLFAQENLSK